MKTHYDHIKPVVICFLCCLTVYLSVRHICKTCLAVEAIHHGMLTIRK